MYPTSLHLVKYKGNYLGTPESIFGFIQLKHAKYITRNLSYENMSITKTSPTSYKIKPPAIKQKINKHSVGIQPIETSVGQYFANINNINIDIIDTISVVSSSPPDINIYTNYKIDSNIDIDDDMRKYHIEMLFDGMKMDYEEEYNNMLILSFLNIMDDQ